MLARTLLKSAQRPGRFGAALAGQARSYHESVVDHFENPRNVGSLDKNDDAVGTALVGAPACGDLMKLQVRIEDGVVVDSKVRPLLSGSFPFVSSIVVRAPHCIAGAVTLIITFLCCSSKRLDADLPWHQAR